MDPAPSLDREATGLNMSFRGAGREGYECGHCRRPEAKPSLIHHTKQKKNGASPRHPILNGALPSVGCSGRPTVPTARPQRCINRRHSVFNAARRSSSRDSRTPGSRHARTLINPSTSTENAKIVGSNGAASDSGCESACVVSRESPWPRNTPVATSDPPCCRHSAAHPVAWHRGLYESRIPACAAASRKRLRRRCRVHIEEEQGWQMPSSDLRYRSAARASFDTTSCITMMRDRLVRIHRLNFLADAVCQ